MINLSASIRNLEKFDKKDLRKKLREIGKEANLKLREWVEGDEWEKLSLERRKQIEGYLVNRGKFYIAPKKATKRELATYISHARMFLNLKPENNEKIPDWLAGTSESFQQFYDPSEFWGVFYAKWYNSGGAEKMSPQMQEDLWFEIGQQLAEYKHNAEDWYNILDEYGWEALSYAKNEFEDEDDDEEEW